MSMRDGEAMKPLLRAMAGASAKNVDETLAALAEAETHLHSHHDARKETAAVRDAVAEREWHRAWLKSYHAICALVWAFPPDRSLCPPPPSDDADQPQRAASTSCSGCGRDLPAGARFCSMCGTPFSA